MSNIPKLRFKEFCDDWEEIKFDQIFSFSTGKNIKQGEASPKFETPCVRYGELYHMYSEVITKVLNKTNIDKSELLFSQGNEILLPSAGEDPLDIGSASALMIPNVAIGRTINILRPLKDNIYYQKYVAYYINHRLRRKISTLAKGASISNVYNSDLKKLNINLPSLEEQEKIASFLSSVDTKIKQLIEKVELLEEYKKGIIEKIFSQKSRFKTNDGSNYPEWEEEKLGDIGEFKTSSVDKKVVKGEKIVNLVNYMNVYKHENITNETVKTFMKVSAKDIQIKTSNLKKGDILFTPSSETADDIGHSVVISKDLENTLYSYHVIRFRPKIQLYILYSHYFCNIPEVLNQIRRVATGTTRFTVSLAEFSKITINLPCVEEQIKIADFLSSIDEKIKFSSEILLETKKFKKALLQQMFI